jgi:hypothetical protein
MRRRDLLLPAILVAAFVGVLMANQGMSRTYIIAAETRGAMIAFEGRNDWFLGAATLCVPREAPQRRGPGPSASAMCDPRLYVETQDPSLMVEWPDGAEIILRREAERFFLRTETPVGALPAKTIISLPTDILEVRGALTFSGRMMIGEPIASGSRGHLIAGDYKVRESNRLSSWFGRRSDLVKSGTLTRGDVASVVLFEDGIGASGFGLITAGDGAHLHAVFHSSAPSAAIKIEALGVRDAIIKPDWIDTILASPYLLVVGLFLGVIANLVSVSFDIADRLSARRAELGSSDRQDRGDAPEEYLADPPGIRAARAGWGFTPMLNSLRKLVR